MNDKKTLITREGVEIDIKWDNPEQKFLCNICNQEIHEKDHVEILLSKVHKTCLDGRNDWTKFHTIDIDLFRFSPSDQSEIDNVRNDMGISEYQWQSITRLLYWFISIFCFVW